MKNLVFLDIDGTILPDGKTKIPADIEFAIKQIEENGHVPFICTGRNAHAARDVINQLGINNYVTSNGQAVTVDGKEVYSSFFNQQTLLEIKDLINECTPHIAVENDYGLNVEDTPSGRQLVKLIIGHGFVDSQAVPTLPLNNIFQIWAFGTKQQLDRVEHEVGSLGELYRWSDDALEIAPAGSGKGNGIDIAKLQYSENIRTIGIGDGVNDINMMKHVDISVAMGNASDLLKQKCVYVTTDCEQRGVENALRHFEIIK